MKIIEIDVNDLKIEPNPDITLCLGYFDGVHIGHLDLINKALESGNAAVMTFDISPSFTLKKNPSDNMLTSLFDKANILKSLGVKYMYFLRMSDELLRFSSSEFIEQILQPINPKKIVVGEDYRFGRYASGTPKDLKEYFDTEVVPLKLVEGKKISSRTIRELVALGEVEEASRLLSRPYTIVGLVVEGNHNGTKIGFPTANLDLDYPYVLPKIGVYMGFVKFMSSKYKCIISVSTHPTIMELNKPLIEVHLISYKGDLYGREIEVQFVKFMRDIYKFDSMDDLKAQLEKDCEVAKKTLQL